MDDFIEYLERYCKNNGKTQKEAMQDGLPWYVGVYTYHLTIEQLREFAERLT